MPINVTQVQQFTDQDMVCIYRQAIALGAFRQEMDYNGRMVRVPDPDTCLRMLSEFEKRVVDSQLQNSEGGDVALVTFGDPT